MVKIYNIFKGDKVIWMIFFFLCMISLVEVYSASSELGYKSGSFVDPILKHGGLLAVGTIVIIVTSHIPCRYFKVMTPFLIPISFLTLVWVLVGGGRTNDAARWISILGIQFQPSEIAKGTIILAVAQILSFMQTENGADKRAFKYILIICAILVAPILPENFSTAALILSVVYLMMIIGRVPAYLLGRLAGVCVIVICLVLGLVFLFGKDEDKSLKAENQLTEQVSPQKKSEESVVDKIFHRFGVWKGRIKEFLAKEEVDPKTFDWDKKGQRGHANIAIASCNVIGKGPGNSVERDWLPQAYSDFIYAIILEELGMGGAFVVLFLYLVLLVRVGYIANNCERNFPAFLILGIALLLVSQAFFNMCVAVGVVPVTGQPLPLISKGGTSTLINCAYIGVILSVSRSAKKKTKLETLDINEG